MNRQRTGFSGIRSGITLLEMTIAMMLLAVAVVMVGQAAALIAQQKRSAGRYQLASQEAANVMEQLAGMSWNQLQTEAVQAVELSEYARQKLPHAALQIVVADGDSQQDAKRIQVEVRWQNLARQASVVRLVCWRYRLPAPERQS